jgi:hypothetical protein
MAILENISLACLNGLAAYLDEKNAGQKHIEFAPRW